jgi:hypothetical protein
LALPVSASAQSSSTLQRLVSFPLQYDTAMGWRPTFGTPSAHRIYAEPTVAAGSAYGQTALLVGANNSIGQFYGALNGSDNFHNSQQDLASVFGGLLPAGFAVTQPQVFRETYPSLPNDRWVILAVGNKLSTKESGIFISATQYLPNGLVLAQCLARFNVNDPPDAGLYADHPHLGNSGNALLVAADLYSYSDNSFQYAKVWMFPKTAIYNNPATGLCPTFTQPNSLVLKNFFGVVPARSYDTRNFAYMVNSLYRGGSSLTGWVLDTTDATTFTGTQQPIPTTSYSTPPLAEQAGTSSLITTWGPMLSNAVYQPNSGLWTASTIGCTPPTDTTQRNCVAWYNVDMASFTIRQQGSVHFPGFHYYSPGIAANDKGDAVLVLNGSSANSYAGAIYVGRYRTDPPNTLQQPWWYKNGEGCFVATRGINSLSSHSDITIDPSNNTLFWLNAAYAYGTSANCQNNDWATYVAAVQFVGGNVNARKPPTKPPAPCAALPCLVTTHAPAP